MTVSFDISFKLVDYGHTLETDDLRRVKMVDSNSRLTKESSIVSYSINSKNTEDIKKLRIHLLEKIEIIFRNKVPFNPEVIDMFIKDKGDPIEFLKGEADKLKNPKDRASYLASFIWTSEYQAHAQRTYDQICASYKELKAPAKP